VLRIQTHVSYTLSSALQERAGFSPGSRCGPSALRHVPPAGDRASGPAPRGKAESRASSQREAPSPPPAAARDRRLKIGAAAARPAPRPERDRGVRGGSTSGARAASSPREPRRVCGAPAGGVAALTDLPWCRLRGTAEAEAATALWALSSGRPLYRGGATRDASLAGGGGPALRNPRVAAGWVRAMVCLGSGTSSLLRPRVGRRRGSRGRAMGSGAAPGGLAPAPVPPRLRGAGGCWAVLKEGGSLPQGAALGLAAPAAQESAAPVGAEPCSKKE